MRLRVLPAQRDRCGGDTIKRDATDSLISLHQEVQNNDEIETSAAHELCPEGFK